MTDDELVRAAMALSGAPEPPSAHESNLDILRSLIGQPVTVGRWSWVYDGEHGDWLPDPHDDGNGGLALGLLGPCEVGYTFGEWWVCPLKAGPNMQSRLTGHSGRGSSIFLACCAVAVSLGRWPGGVR